MEKIIEIVEMAYLKNKKYRWTLKNSSGGSFSNSGDHTSWTKCVEHARIMTSENNPVFTFRDDGETLKLDTEKSSINHTYPQWAKN